MILIILLFIQDVMFYEKRGNAESDGIGLC